jgi:hypothetical protein
MRYATNVVDVDQRSVHKKRICPRRALSGAK